MQMSLAVATVLWVTALAGLSAWAFLSGSSAPGDDLTRRTVWVSLAFYAWAAWLMLGLRSGDWRGNTLRSSLARWCWTLGWAAFVIHVAVAFHFYHGWSHAAAVEHVRERAGVGEGVFVSYLFTVVWTADVVYWWLSPERYATRPAWVDRTIHGFMAFMVVMATVVYEEGAIRWAGLAMSVALTARWAAKRQVKQH